MLILLQELFVVSKVFLLLLRRLCFNSFHINERQVGLSLYSFLKFILITLASLRKLVLQLLDLLNLRLLFRKDILIVGVNGEQLPVELVILQGNAFLEGLENETDALIVD